MSGVRRSLHDRGGRGDTADRLRTAAARGSGAKAAVAVRSPEVTAALVLLAGIATAALAGPAMAAAGGELLRSFFARAALAGGGAELTGLLPEAALGHVARMGLPLVVAGVVAAVAGHLVQTGASIRMRIISPRWRRIAPNWTRVTRRLWSGEAAFNAGRELLKVGAVTVVAVLNVGAALRAMAAAPAGTPLVAQAAFGAAFRIAVQGAAALVVLAAADYLFRYLRARRRTHRSVAEEREERRQQEGDPLVRDRLRARMRALLARTATDQVAAADVVISDPARAAVALRWDRVTMTAPVVVAKAAGAGVRQMRAAAESHGVTVVEQPALAGSLWHAVALGDAIGQPYQPPVAAILAARAAVGVRGGARWQG